MKRRNTSDPQKNVYNPEQDLQKLFVLSNNYYSWTSFSIVLMILGVTINIDLHYIIGAVTVILGLILLISTLVINVMQTLWRSHPKTLIHLWISHLWITRIVVFLIIPLMIWAVVVILQKSEDLPVPLTI